MRDWLLIAAAVVIWAAVGVLAVWYALLILMYVAA